MPHAEPTNPAPETARPRKPRYAASVRRIARLSPRMIRVTFAGSELAQFTWNGPAAHIKLIFPAAAPEGPAAMRTYTPRRFDPSAGELDVEFVIHGEGPASAWAAQAQVGQQLTIAGPGRSYGIDTQAPWYLLAGDDSAIPAICTIVEALPAGTEKLLLLEVVDAAEERALEAPGAIVRWLPRGADPSRAGASLEAALRATELPAGPGRLYVACEAGAMRRIRGHLLHERGVARDRLVTRGYWKLGATDHPDRDYGDDVT